jgi:DNA-binding transcriptional regulator YhcF (GntR family)
MVYLLLIPDGKSIGVRPLAEFLRVSPTYLSKILTKLVKAGIVESATGVNEMVNAELKMETYLKEKKIKELTEKVDSSVIAFITNESR